MYVGNNKPQQELLKWVKQSFVAPSVKYCIIEGKIGNGKTSLVQHIASTLDIPIYTLYPEDVSTKDDINGFLQGINLTTIYGDNHKIVLIEDIDKFRKNSNAHQIHKYTKYPVIYTTSDSYTLDKFFVRNSLQIKIKKPNPKTLLPLMHEQMEKYNIKLSDEELYRIAKTSPSVRSALITILSNSVRKSENNKINFYFDLMSVRNKRLQNDFNYPFLEYCFRHIHNFDEESLDVRKHLSYLDYHICFENFNNKSTKILKEIINYYPNSLDSIELKTIKLPKEIKDTHINVTKDKNQQSLSDFF